MEKIKKIISASIETKQKLLKDEDLLRVIENIVDHQRNELLGEMIGPVIIAAVGKYYRQAIRMVPGHHKMIGGRFGRRIRASGIVGRLLRKETFMAQRAVYFIGGYMIE